MAASDLAAAAAKAATAEKALADLQAAYDKLGQMTARRRRRVVAPTWRGCAKWGLARVSQAIYMCMAFAY